MKRSVDPDARPVIGIVTGLVIAFAVWLVLAVIAYVAFIA